MIDRLATPTLDFELNELAQRHCQLVGGMDEVGRGALAGPVCVGLVCASGKTPQPPPGLRDSKMLTAAHRESLVPGIVKWAESHAIGWAGPREIDRLGIVGALHLAGHRAIAALPAPPPRLILDGSHDWLTPKVDLFSADDEGWPCSVVTMVKADQACATVAAASVLAKVARDRLMVELDNAYQAYHFASNKGYGSLAHRRAIDDLGLSPIHRASWALLKHQNP